jgi:hypothetical protein
MRIQIEPTELFADTDGQECRIWNGITEDGQQVFVFVRWIATRADLDAENLIKLDENRRKIL